MHHIFGPVPSRRLGRSLGIDLVPFKTCSYDCIYCQLGATTNKSVERREWMPLNDILEELPAKLESNPDYITLSGSGEPTLYSRIDELIAGIRAQTDIPIAVLTNGSLLWQPEVRRQLLAADLIIPSLDAGNAEMFQWVNRPHESITYEKIVAGLRAMREEYNGQYWLEVFALAGYTAIEAEMRMIALRAREIQPDRVQINTVTRPPTEDYAVMVESERLSQLAALFDTPAEIIADYQSIHAQSVFADARENILALLQRRPCSLEDISDGLGMHRNEVLKYIEELDGKHLIEKHTSGARLFYRGKQS